MWRWAFFPFLLAGFACERRCDAIFNKLEQDWCYSGHAARAARRGDLPLAKRYLAKVQSVRVRAVTVERILTADPPGLDREGAEKLCATWAGEWATRCLGTWSQEHLWVPR